ncbi:hypothetical protein [Holospora curviuscula]|uniref:Uncharacterized protein n=1 Tax=Holospora curviuscula TaxID=1082868 RepID=A0A2S5R860_9PROT|nr:hypothetical protein [Holospora curviuscula]PPE03521.1 hypothetical protein HCUR_01065 [Holospora curviuscula]
MIIYWRDRESPLSVQEVDGNFEHIVKELTQLEKYLKVLEARITDLVSMPKSDEKKISLLCKENIISLTDPLGEVHEIHLPLWQFKGDWTQDAQYYPGNLVLLEQAVYRCCESTCESPFVSSAWEKLPFQVLGGEKQTLPKQVK